MRQFRQPRLNFFKDQALRNLEKVYSVLRNWSEFKSDTWPMQAFGFSVKWGDSAITASFIRSKIVWPCDQRDRFPQARTWDSYLIKKAIVATGSMQEANVRYHFLTLDVSTGLLRTDEAKSCGTIEKTNVDSGFKKWLLLSVTTWCDDLKHIPLNQLGYIGGNLKQMPRN